MRQIFIIISACSVFILFACTQTDPEESFVKLTNLNDEMHSGFNKYWYNNEAEITSYKLEQARYGEIHHGNAVLIFVTEHISKKYQVKTDNPSNSDLPVLKLNFTKKFTTGIYPYSMLTSTFVPVNDLDKHAIKVTTTSQEWCGHAYLQLNRRKDKYELTLHSYFEDEGDKNLTLDESWLEDEIWTKIRLNPELLPLGETEMIPSFFYLRLMHKKLKPYKVKIKRDILENGKIAYTIQYPELDRVLTIFYNNTFPYKIEGWEETYVSGWSNTAKKLTTKATKLKTLKTDYWNKHNTNDSILRKELKL